MERVEEEYQDYKVERAARTCSNHYWVESPSQDSNSELLSVNCTKCPIGANINPKKLQVEDGKIVKC